MKSLRITATLLVVLSLAACSPEEPPATDPSPSATLASTPEPVETAAEPVDAGLTADDYENIAASIESGNTAALEGYLAPSVNFIIAASECCGPSSPVDAILGLDYLADATGPWTHPVPEATVDTYRAGFYAEYFPEGAFVLASADDDPFIVSFTITGARITGIFIASGATLLAD